MRNDARGDVLKVWLYAMASVFLGAWVSPLLYNAGKALADVSANKTMNGLLQWLAGLCRAADFKGYFGAAILLAAMVLFLPWMEWIHARRGPAPDGTGPWLLRLPDGARMTSRGQPLRRNLRGLWDCCAGFMLVAGLLLSLGVALVPAGYFTMRVPGTGMAPVVTRAVLGSLGVAMVMEVFFRGVVMGIFLRAMRPAAALCMSAAFFALALSVVPHGLNVAGPDAGQTGFDLLGLSARRFADWRSICGDFAPLLALGAVLAYARWRTASLWLPIGLHTGWLAAKAILASLSQARGAGEVVLSGALLQQGLIPLAAIVLAGFLAHHITFDPEHEEPVFP